MLKLLEIVNQGFHPGNHCAVNTTSVLYLAASKNDPANTTITCLGDKRLFLSGEVAHIINVLEIGLVKLKRLDRAGRPDFNYDIWIAPPNIKTITQVANFYLVEFVDGTTVDIVSPEPLIQFS